MPKTSGLGDNFYVGGYDLSGDINAVNTIGNSVGTLDVTGINKYGYERVGGQIQGSLEFTSLFNPTTGQAHDILSDLPTANVQMSYFRGQAVGNPAASMIAKQPNYDASRSDDGDLKFQVQAVSNGYGLEWGQQLTAGVRTDTAATNGASIDTTASLSFGGQAYLHVFGFTGTDVTIKIQDSANNSAWTDVTSFGFTQVTAGNVAQRLQLGSTATLRRYLRVITVTTAGFTSVAFAVNVVKNTAAIQF
jgi:hypothetical protein